MFGVSETTLRERLKGRKPRTEETHANNNISLPIQEEVLVKQILNADKHGFSIHPEFLCQMAQILLQKQTPTSTPNIRSQLGIYLCQMPCIIVDTA